MNATNPHFIMFKFAIFIIILIPTYVWGEMPKTEEEFMQLPPYCRARLSGKNTPDYSYWNKKLGSGFIHVHHSCEGYNYLNKARVTFGSERKKYFKYAIAGIDYVLGATDQTFILTPDLLTKKGEALEGLGKIEEAKINYEAAIKINKKYPFSYLRLSKIYIKQDQKDQAKVILKKGLSANPNSKTLKRKLQDLK